MVHRNRGWAGEGQCGGVCCGGIQEAVRQVQGHPSHPELEPIPALADS